MYDIPALKRRQIMGVWAMEVLHAMVGWPDLYLGHGSLMGDWDNMTYNAGTHSCAHLKLRPGWLAATDVADHQGHEHDYDLQSLSTMTPPPGRFAAVRIRSTKTGNVFMAEARLKSDVYERGFGPQFGGGLEFRGLPGSGVIVYQTHDDLQETLFAGGPLVVGQTYDNAAEGFSIRVLAAIAEGVTIRVTMMPDPRCRQILEQLHELDDLLADETDIELLKALRHQRQTIHDRAVQLGCLR
jgi:hypothetical protein